MEAPGLPDSEAILREAFRRSLQPLLAQLPPRVVAGIRRGAVAHSLDLDLLAILTGDEQLAQTTLVYLIGLGLAHFETSADRLRYEPEIRRPFEQIAPGGLAIPAALLQSLASLHALRFRYAEMARQALLEEWRQAEDQAGFQAANRLILEQYQRRLAQAAPDMRQHLEVEIAYHLLAVDEPAGVEYLAERFEQACERRHLDIARALTDTLDELYPHLAPHSQEWQRYFAARLDWLSRAQPASPAVFQALAQHAADERVRALALWQLGEMALRSQDWTASIRNAQNSLSLLARLGQEKYAGRVMLTLGDAYLDLSERSGGRPEQPAPEEPGVSRFLLAAQNLPFLAYHWIAQRLPFLPGGRFVGTNYQSWIISYLLSQASRWYRRAERSFARLGDPLGLVQARLALAEIELVRQSTRRAEIAYARLAGQEEVIYSPYRTARLQHGLGRVALDRQDYAAAIPPLEKAVSIFRYFRDWPAQGSAGLNLGRAYAGQGQLGAAAASYGQSLSALVAAGDRLAQTRLVWEIEALAGRPGLSAGDRRELADLLARAEDMPARSYLAPFPEGLLRLFRRIAIVFSLPLALLLALVFSLILADTLSTVEGLLQLDKVDPSGRILTSSNVLILAASLILPLPVTVWTFEMVYALVGFWMVRLLGWLVAPIARESPEIVAISSQGLSIQSGEARTSRQLAWSQVRSAASGDICLWRRPIQLISRQYFKSEGEVLEIKGVTHGYADLKRQVDAQLKDHPPRRSLDLVILHPLWMLGVVLFSVWFAWYVVVVLENLRILVGTSTDMAAMTRMTFSSVASLSIFSLFFFLPPVTLWRVIRHSLQLRKKFPQQYHAIPLWLTWLAAAGSSLLALAWLLLWLFGSGQ